MKLTIHLTASGAKRLLLVGSVLIVLGTAAVGLAALPHSFNKGETLTAKNLNDNFTALDNAGKAITVGGKSYSRSAVFKKATGSKQGKLGSSANGYADAKSLCESAVGSLSAHMCTTDELARSAQLGIAVPQGWYASGVMQPGSSSTNSNDCQGWTNNGLTSGAVWYKTTGKPGYPGAISCSTPEPVLCCD